MQKLLHLLIAGTALTLASCGAKTDNAGGNLADMKARLATLQQQQNQLNDSIGALQSAIEKLDPAAAKADKAKLVSLTTITPVTFNHFIDLQGKVESENVSYITPRGAGGQVKTLYVKRGDMVAKGQLLLKLDDAIARQAVASADQSVEALRSQLNLAKDLYQKQKNLWDQNIGTEVQLITAKNNVQTLESQLKGAEAQAKIAHEQLQFTSVYSDVSGVAEDVNIKVGELFMGSGQIKIVNTSNLKVTTQIPENYINRVHVGSKLKISLPDIHKTLDATVSVSGKLIDPNSRSFFIEAKIPSDKDFHPNQVAMVSIQDYAAPNAITVPLNTLQTDENGKYVMVASLENGKLIARKRIVVPGEFYGDVLEIKSGLQAGDKVISDGYQSLYDGQLITTDQK
ncbi:MAG TPA: efflux RND transporter periplasmic adaptor subunit [Sediminibacterium sp.]|nr:efflux RND transporter periplasmic adaptor subunit [Sediminibacterium sp.]